MRALLLALVTAGVGLSARQAEPAPEPPRSLAFVEPEPAPPYDGTAEPAEAVLSLVPRTADTITVMDWDRVRQQVGLPDLTSEDLMSDRIACWERAGTEAALLTDGLLRGEASTLELGDGFTQDDVDWEARWTGENGPGYVLALRPDLELAGVRRAIADGIAPLEDAELVADEHLVVSGTSDVDVWGNEEQWGSQVDEPATASYLQRGCSPLNEALGPDADAEDQEALLAEHRVTTLDELPGFALTYGDGLGRARAQRPVRATPDRGGLAGPGLPGRVRQRRRRPLDRSTRLRGAGSGCGSRTRPARRAAVRHVCRRGALGGADRPVVAPRARRPAARASYSVASWALKTVTAPEWAAWSSRSRAWLARC